MFWYVRFKKIYFFYLIFLNSKLKIFSMQRKLAFVSALHFFIKLNPISRIQWKYNLSAKNFNFLRCIEIAILNSCLSWSQLLGIKICMALFYHLAMSVMLLVIESLKHSSSHCTVIELISLLTGVIFNLVSLSKPTHQMISHNTF